MTTNNPTDIVLNPPDAVEAILQAYEKKKKESQPTFSEDGSLITPNSGMDDLLKEYYDKYVPKEKNPTYLDWRIANYGMTREEDNKQVVEDALAHAALGGYTDRTSFLGPLFDIGLGFTPAGAATDLRDIVYSVQHFKGDKEGLTDLMLSFGAVIPVLGDGAKGLNKLRKVERVYDAVDEYGNVYKISDNADEAADMVRKGVKKAEGGQRG